VSHEIGLFFSPSVQVQAYGGLQVEGVGSVDANAAWGTVMSFGANRGRGVEAGFKGAFFNVGVSGNAAAGLEGTVGQNFYVGGRSVFGSPGSPGTTTPGTTTPGTTTPGTTTPGTTTPGTTTPGTTTPGTTTPDTPAQSHVIASRAALFDTQKSDITGATRSMIGDVVGTIGSQRASKPNATFQISVVGEASRRWRHPGRSSADQLNADLYKM